MKRILLISILSLLIQACASQPQPQVIVPAPALREVFRGGAIQGLEDNSGHFTGMPNSYDLVEHVCTSSPIFDIHGKYVRTAVSCW